MEPECLADFIFYISRIRKVHQFFIIDENNKCRRLYDTCVM